MKLKDIKYWFSTLPIEFDEYECVSAEEGETIENNTLYRCDLPIVSLNVCEETKEILFLNDKPKYIINKQLN